MLLSRAHGRAALGLGDADALAATRDLATLGLAPAALTDADRRLLGLLASFDLRLEVGQPAPGPAWLAVTLDRPQGGAPAEACTGKGWRPADAVRGCLGELAEHRSWLARGGEPVTITADPGSASAVLWPEALLPYAPEQLALRETLNAVWGGHGEIAAPWRGEPIAWCGLVDMMGGPPALAPASLCYGEAPAAWSGGVAGLTGDSNGCAAGATITAAEVAALLEVIERDAAAIWWHARCRRPALDVAARAAPELGEALAQRQGGARRTWLIDLTHDLGVPVVAAVSLDPERGLPALGLGAALGMARAAETAFLELCQAELSLELHLRRRREGLAAARPDEARALDAWLRLATPARLAWLVPDDVRVVDEAAAAEPALACRAALLAALQRRGLRAFRLDLTRPGIGVPVVKALVPGACTLKPRLGAARLLEVPVAMGWGAPGLSRADLETLPLPF